MKAPQPEHEGLRGFGPSALFCRGGSVAFCDSCSILRRGPVVRAGSVSDGPACPSLTLPARKAAPGLGPVTVQLLAQSTLHALQGRVHGRVSGTLQPLEA